MTAPTSCERERLILWNKYNRVCRFVQRVADNACRRAAYEEARDVLKMVDWQPPRGEEIP